ncbi:MULTISPECIES: molybdopterin molybdotransferase MoeA [unclassified Campylobacter]|uniref:molybdopterin molybdotransferase MoeA n=1 Tax=unclassified Campylobacter TaxID=2593542 RepID=UPI0022E9D9D2|nr:MULTISPECIES: molybdopterin molybdotransferase MoeA [unclassified Campylobacter]MDA3054729.1 molybdopterin molybdotransferase MoeA [Campylobacter sp. VBCF_07 NA4]MDA3061238.1 molybdopterin molybdotransferase MoeA [Campylobacter sp. VBCF_02 NA5]MDA3070678.1 molybdopterin molybdotransferase MoeA [Campylobacter sp. VBCF_08 NA3]WBR54185.1 molybdopterin molybdotransferase MoeA [Campylobacter sp. VBCF_01 NA2]
MQFESLQSAVARFKASVAPEKKSEILPLNEALGRILADEIRAPFAKPAHPTASMDGYALNSANLACGAKFKVISQTPAGSMPMSSPKSGECVKTFTGAIMAEGADTLVPVENVSVCDDEIIIDNPVPAGFAVRKIGESYEKGEVLLSANSRLNFASIALLAELGMASVAVFARPKVAIIATGSEIKRPGESLENEAQIYSSNNFALLNLARAMGFEVVSEQIISDDKDALKSALFGALTRADIVITSGGVSMGDYDFMKALVRENFEILVDKIAIKPGRHVKIAKFGEKFIFALPGFPLSSIVTGFLFLRAFLSAKFGLDDGCESSAILSNDYAKKSPFLEFALGDISVQNGQIFISTAGKKQGSSAILNNFGPNSALLIAEQNLSANSVVKILQIPRW